MNIVSFNVNSVRLRLHQLQAVIDTYAPEIIGLQETKVVDADFPMDAMREMGYESIFAGQKTHYGVAMLSTLPMRDVTYGFSGDADDAQRRMISARVTTGKGNDVLIMNGYFPQGENREHPVKFPAKQRFYADLLARLESDCKTDEHIAIIGDFNVAPIDADIGIGADNMRRWLRSGQASFLPEEREWLQQLKDWGLDDTYRIKYPDHDDRFSWFDYRSKGFDRDPKRGIRIDHLLTTAPMTATLLDSGMDYQIRAMEKPSDHCPVWSSFDL